MSTRKTGDITLLPYRERVKLIRERLSGMRWPKHTDIPKSKRVLAAEKVMNEYNERNEKARRAGEDAHRERRNAVQDALILGDTETALKLLKQFGA